MAKVATPIPLSVPARISASPSSLGYRYRQGPSLANLAGMFSIIKEGRPEGRPSNFGSSRALTRLGFRHRAIRSTLHEAELAGILEFGLRNLPIIVGVGQLEVGDVGSCLVGR
jgi:hypothetical protein